MWMQIAVVSAGQLEIDQTPAENRLFRSSDLFSFRGVSVACLVPGKTLDTGEGVQQSWVVAPLMNSVCYDVSAP